MKRLLNTLYVTSQGAYLAKEGESVVVRVDRQDRLRVPIHTIGSIIGFGQVSCSPYLMAFCAERQVAISFLSENGRFLARIEGPISGNVLLRREQYRLADEEPESAAVARPLVTAKLINSRRVLMRGVRDHADKGDTARLERCSSRLQVYLRRIEAARGLDELRGVEGDASRTYFEAFDDLITAQKSDFFFRGRNRRPPTDRMNALLSFVYTLLLHDVRSAIESVGLDPQVGFLHRDRPGRPSLALDLMEEFRPWLADRLVLSLVNRKQIQGKAFVKSEAGAVTMSNDTRKTLLVAYQKRKQEEVHHPFLKEKVTVGLLFQIQSQLLARHLRSDMDAYAPFFWR